jgi:hypothetical protein
MDMIVQKEALIKWIHSIEDSKVLDKIEEIKRSAFDFEKEWEKSLSISQARQKTKDFVKSLPWKK